MDMDREDIKRLVARSAASEALESMVHDLLDDWEPGDQLSDVEVNLGRRPDGGHYRNPCVVVTWRAPDGESKESQLDLMTLAETALINGLVASIPSHNHGRGGKSDWGPDDESQLGGE